VARRQMLPSLQFVSGSQDDSAVKFGICCDHDQLSEKGVCVPTRTVERMAETWVVARACVIVVQNGQGANVGEV
jgi:hypothetical protein